MSNSRRPLLLAAVAALLLIMAAEMISSVRGQSLTWDEDDHIYSGYMNWRYHDMGLNPEHPPLAKYVATLPLLPLHLHEPPRNPSRFFKTEAYLNGRELLFRNGPANGGRYPVTDLTFRARLAVIVFPLTLALLVFLAGWEMFGLAAGLLALTLLVFEPNILAHGMYVTTDVPVSCMFFAAIYTFYRWVRRPVWQRLAVAGTASGFALAAKHSAVLLLPMLLVLIAGELLGRWWLRRQATAEIPASPVSSLRHGILRDAGQLTGGLLGLALIAVAVLWSFYGFRYSMKPGGGPMQPTLVSTMEHFPAWKTAGVLFFAKYHLLPESYLYGLVDVQRVADFTPTYLLGRVYAHGVHFYFPVVFLIKYTLGAGALLLLSIYAFATGRLRRPRELWFLFAPVAVYLFVAITSPLNIGVRHALPVFGFLLVLTAGGAAALVQRDRRWLPAIAALVLFHIGSSLHARPTYLAYSNEAWGGPSQTHRYLSDSATDWGQQLLAVKAYTDSHGIHDCWFAYFAQPFVRFEDYGIPCKPLPTLDSASVSEPYAVPPVIHGPVLISFGDLNGFEYGTRLRNSYQSFLERTPDDVIQHGVAVFQGTFAVPDASAQVFIQEANNTLATNPAASVAAAQRAVALSPRNFDANLALGDALLATGNKTAAQAAWRMAGSRIADMEPSAQQQWQPELDKRLR